MISSYELCCCYPLLFDCANHHVPIGYQMHACQGAQFANALCTYN